MHERVRAAILGRWGRAVAQHPHSTIFIALALAGAAVMLAVTGLRFVTDRSALVSAELEWNRSYAEYKQEFPRWDQILIVLEGEPRDESVDALARTIGERLKRDRRIAFADAAFDPLANPRLWRTAARAEFDRALAGFAVLKSVAAAPNVNSALATLLSFQQSVENAEAALENLDAILAPFLSAARGEEATFVLPGFSDRAAPENYRSDTGRIRFIFTQFAREDESASGLGESIQWLRTTVGAIVREHPGVEAEWGVTGIPAIEADETAQSTQDSTRASILALIAIITLMVIVFHGVSVPILAASSLLIGISWSFGWVVISVGHLQILSMVFTVILLGLGIDFALHIIARLELIREEHIDLAPAVSRVFRAVGPGMTTGALTTAAAFASIALTDFKGAAEMGMIAAGGILLCLIAVVSTFPALLALTGRWKTIVRHRRGGEARPFGRGRFEFVARHPVIVVIASVALLAGLLLAALRVRYDPNVLNLQPPNVQSVRWEHRLIEDDARSVWSAIVLADPEQAEAQTDRLRAVEGVSDVGGMGMLYPADRGSRVEAIESLRATPPQPIAVPPGPDMMLTILEQVRARLGGETDPDARALAARISESMAAAESVGPSQLQRAWQGMNDSFAALLEDVSAYLDRALALEPMSADDLPGALRAQFVGRTGRWLLRVYPEAGEHSVLHPDRLGPFVQALRDAAPDVIGPPVQIYESSRLIQRAYLRAAVYAFAAIIILLLLDFRSLYDALSAVLPVVMGFVGVFGLMGLAGVPLNFANMIVMPIILGIGVDAGVHVVHRWRAEPLGRPAGLSGGTGRSITMTMTTTMIGFGCMLIAEHRGIRSLGFVMVVGLGTTLLACYMLLPAILHLRKPIQREVQEM